MRGPSRIRNHDPARKLRARQLRADPTWSEAALWEQLRRQKLGFKIRRQVPIGPWIVDFYCVECRLAIELDGSSHEFTAKSDAYRDDDLARRGVQVIRVATGQIEDGTAIGLIARRLVEISNRRPPEVEPYLA
ncbi:MAG: DUF559 domain-containing protein [Fimbriimonadaceae bacterium]